jgi:hypothetical protein
LNLPQRYSPATDSRWVAHSLDGEIADRDRDRDRFAKQRVKEPSVG